MSILWGPYFSSENSARLVNIWNERLVVKTKKKKLKNKNKKITVYNHVLLLGIHFLKIVSNGSGKNYYHGLYDHPLDLFLLPQSYALL